MKPKTYATATAFRRALEDRLSTVTKAEGVDLQRIRRHVAFDRLLRSSLRRAKRAVGAERRLRTRTETRDGTHDQRH